MATDWLLLLPEIFLLITAIAIHARSQDPSGFISIDCGMGNGTGYVDSVTGLTYVPDEIYIDQGVNSIISSEYLPSFEKIHASLRYFPNGTRNCYVLKPVIQYQKYLLRVSFTYGNYDGLQAANKVKPLQFDVYIDVNLWTTVEITDAAISFTKEAIFVSLVNNSVSVCLVNTGNGVPFISYIELRPIDSDMYTRANATQFLHFSFYRRNLGVDYTIRYPTDPYDRIWVGWVRPDWVNISSDVPVGHYPNNSDELRVPSAIMQTAVVPDANVTNKVSFYWDFASSGYRHNVFYPYLHFAELVALRPNQSRALDIMLNGRPWLQNYSPPYLMAQYVYSDYPLDANYTYVWELVRNATSTLLPIFNALEVYSVMYITNQPTTSTDVEAITAIKDEYKVKKYWTGDPCVPSQYMWEDLNCSYDAETPTIVAVNLSSSGLTGDISPLFGQLTALKYLDLSYNRLTGTVPDTLGDLSSLQLLNLCGNNISTNVPASLIKRMNHGLQIIFDCPNGPKPVPCTDCDKKKSKLNIVIPSVVVVVVVLLASSVFVIWSVRRRRRGPVINIPIESHKEDYPSHYVYRPSVGNVDQQRSLDEKYLGQIPKAEERLIKVETMKFTHVQLAKITNNYSRKIGRGGFGNVYHGYVETGIEVAVKIQSESSPRGAKHFLAEVQNLTRASHRNLVKLIGYCIDDKSLALVYEYMPHGSLQERLKGIAGRVLSWRERIQIAAGAAQGLEYLHKWCSPPLIHRDIKSANILLDKDLEAKLADFGLSKAFNYGETHVSTAVVAGTTGYVDPEYHITCQLTEKSDVFSFGVVLLELLTGQPPIVPHLGKPHLIQVVTSGLADGSIEEIMDQRLEGAFDANSAWKIAELAKWCTTQTSAQRPAMTEVLLELKDCLELEVTRVKRENRYNDEFNMRPDTAFEIGPSAR